MILPVEPPREPTPRPKAVWGFCRGCRKFFPSERELYKLSPYCPSCAAERKAEGA